MPKIQIPNFPLKIYHQQQDKRLKAILLSPTLSNFVENTNIL